jgi:hypothetical protein
MKTVKPMDIRQRIAGMMQENTGTHLLDSGGAYGRNWEKNQGKNFEKESVVKIDGYEGGDFNLSVSTYHFLVNHLEVTPASEKLNERFHKFMDKEEDRSYLADMEEFMDELFGKDSESVDIYGDEDGRVGKIDNTYNYDNLLDQTLQYGFFRKDGKEFVILQVHGGCDVRGGYTEPQIFEVTEGFDYWLIHMQDLNAYENGKTYHSDDAGYHWYKEDGGEFDIKNWRYDVAKKGVINVKTKKHVNFTVGFE